MKMQIVAAVCAGTALGLFAVNGTKERAMRQLAFRKACRDLSGGRGSEAEAGFQRQAGERRIRGTKMRC